MIQLNPPRRVRVYDSKNPGIVYDGQAIAASYYQGNEDNESAFSLLVIVDIPGGAASQFREVVVPYVPGSTIDITTWRIEDHGEVLPLAMKSGE